MIQLAALVGLGGFCGALVRFGIGEVSTRMFGTAFPVGTLCVNVMGCFLVGVMIGIGLHDNNERVRHLFSLGFLGSLTTFSAFGAETMGHVSQNENGLAALNIGLNMILGLTAVVVGTAVGRRFANVP